MSGIIIPYRAAAADGFGPQPLYDPATGAAIPLWEFPQAPRSPLDEVNQAFTHKPPPPRLLTRASSVLLQTTGEAQNDVAAHWRDELERIQPAYEEGRRHHLVLGLSAHGLRLGVLPQQIEADVLRLAQEHDDDELDMRRVAISTTLKRAAAGQRIAAHQFYRRAGLNPPTTLVSPEVQTRLLCLREAMLSFAWPGRQGFTARSVYRVLLNLGWEFGKLHPLGVEVQVAWRQLAELADVGSRNTLQGALSYLEGQELLQRAGRGHGEVAGSFLLPMTADTILTKRGSGTPGVFALGRSQTTPSFRNGRGRLGKQAEALFDLVMVFQPFTLDLLARRLRRPRAGLARVLVKLTAAGLLDRSGPQISVNPGWWQALQEIEGRDQSHQARQKQKQRHQNERDRYRKAIQQLGRHAPARPKPPKDMS